MGIPIAVLIFLGVATALFALPAVAGDALAAIGITNDAVTTALVLVVSAGGVGGAIHYALDWQARRRRRDV